MELTDMESIAASAPLSQLCFVAFDTETTGLSPVAAKLIELCGVKFSLKDGVIDTFATLIDPQDDIPPEATAVHGITDDMVDGQPSCREAVTGFFEWLGTDSTVLAAHNAPFDIGFLDTAISRLRLPVPSIPVLDTLNLSRRLLPEAPNHRLQTLAEFLQLESGGYHRALADSHHVRNLLVKLLSLVPEVTCWSDLTGYCNPFKFSDLGAPILDRLHTMPAGFDYIATAITNGEKVSLVYRGSRSYRLVTPRSVHSWKGNVYLTAYCHLSDAERTFRLDKIDRFQPAAEAEVK
jgi:DNA polymerase III epsilon subunit family exonuclease